MIQEDEAGGSVEPGASEVVDLSARLRPRPPGAASGAPEGCGYALFLVVSRDSDRADHKLHYVFLGSSTTVIEAQNFVRSHPSTFGQDVAVVELRESFSDVLQAVEKARVLKGAAPGANVLAPALGLGRLEEERG